MLSINFPIDLIDKWLLLSPEVVDLIPGAINEFSN
jgi:hypothetical protein